MDQIEKVKPLYKELDIILETLGGVVMPFEVDGYRIEVVDNFRDPKTGHLRNTVFRPAAVRRFELRFTRTPERRKT